MEPQRGSKGLTTFAYRTKSKSERGICTNLHKGRRRKEEGGLKKEEGRRKKEERKGRKEEATVSSTAA